MKIRPVKELTIMQSYVVLGDPHLWTDSKNRLSPRFAVYDALVDFDDAGQYQPALATAWQVEADARQWTFHLRQGVRFHHFGELTAKDVVGSLKRATDPQMEGEMGTRALLGSYLGDAQFEELDRYTVQICIPEPMADLLDILVWVPIVPACGMSQIENDPIGTGPFRLIAEQDGGLVMERYIHCWRGMSPVEKLIWKAEPDGQKRTAALISGQADMISEVEHEGKEQIGSSRGFHLPSWDSNLCVIFMCNCQNGPCGDVRVRQALNYALDKQAIIQTVMQGDAKVLTGPLSPHHFGYDPAVAAYPYDPDFARQLLAEAGYSEGLKLVLDIPTIHPNESRALANQFAQYLLQVGVQTEIRVFEDRLAYALMVKDKQIGDLCCFDSSPLSTYRSLREKFHSGVAGPWWQGYDNAQVNVLLEKAWARVDDGERCKIYQQAFGILHDEAPWIYLYRPVNYWGVGPKAMDWQPGVDELIRVG